MRLNVLATEADLIRLECTEDLTLLELREGEEPLDRVLGPDCWRRTVLLSLAGASYIDSAGIGWLVMCHKHFLDGGGRLVLHSIPPMVQHAFGILGLTELLNLAGDERAARVLATAPVPGVGV